LAGPTERISEVLARLDAVEPVQLPGRLDEAVALALNLLSGGARGTDGALAPTVGAVHVYSDTAPAQLARTHKPADARVRWRRIGDDSLNVGIVAFDVEASPPPGKPARIFAALFNASRTPARVTLELNAFAVNKRGRSGKLAARSLTVPPRTSTRVRPLLAAPLEGVEGLELKLHAVDGDALDADSAVWAVRGHAGPLRVAVVGRAPASVLDAVRAEGAAVPVPLDGQDPLPDDADVAIYYCTLPAAPPARPAIFMDPGSSLGPLHLEGTPLRGQVALDAEAAHPLMRAPLDSLREVWVRGARRVKLIGEFQTLATARGVPVLGLWHEGALPRCYVGFGLEKDRTNWAQHPTWPIFMAKLLRRFRRGGAPGRFIWVRTGERPARELAGLPASVELIGPRGQSPAAAQPLLLAGLYRVADATGEPGLSVVPANLLDAAQTDITPSPPQAGELTLTLAGQVRTRRNLLLAALIALLAVLLAEWAAYELTGR
jgi:hypothetical protein